MASDIDELVNGHAYGVVDATMRSRLPQGVRPVPLVPRRLAGSAHLMPALIDLGSAPEPVLQNLFAGDDRAVRGTRDPVVSVLLKTTVGMDEVERRWNAMQLVSPDGRGFAWLRMHDPRVLHQLFRILSAAQCRHLFGRIDAITYWIGGDRIERTIGSRAQQPLANRDWARVARIGVVNRALERACMRDAAGLDACSQTVEEALDRAASRYGLLEVGDLTEFGFRALVCRSGFDDDPRVAAAISQHAANRRDSSLSDHFPLIDPDVWRTLRNDAWSETGD